MRFFGVDLGSQPDRTAIATSTAHEWSIGQRIWGLASNRNVSRILRAISATQAEIVTHRRPTRGYARHIRRQKQRARR